MPAGARLDAQLDAPALGELEGVGEQVLEDLLEELPIGRDAAAARRARSRSRSSSPRCSATGRKVRSTKSRTLVERVGLEVRLDPPGLDLREIEDLVDEREQVAPGRVDRRRPLLLLAA